MFRDPLYRQIRRSLRLLKDGSLFEECANDLLKKIYPSLAPREGGDDAGLDGLIAVDHSSSIQLICTTAENVLENLSTSISANLEKDGKSSSCILATSRKLTNKLKQTLEERAGKLGRPLMQIYDQAAFAAFLYRDADWLKELLGLSGKPPPLSLFPITNRPFSDAPPIGRENDILALIKATKDLVLIGQPGSGKTQLLYNVAKKNAGRFVVDEDLGCISDCLRENQPRLLIVDDAHSRLDFLKRLSLLRQQLHLNFRIIAMALAAMEKGFTAEQIFAASQRGGLSWSGSRSSQYDSQLCQFQEISNHSDPRIRSVAEIGIKVFSGNRDRWLQIEKRAAIKGELC
jgi:hypothetical protein